MNVNTEFAIERQLTGFDSEDLKEYFELNIIDEVDDDVEYERFLEKYGKRVSEDEAFLERILTPDILKTSCVSETLIAAIDKKDLYDHFNELLETDERNRREFDQEIFVIKTPGTYSEYKVIYQGEERIFPSWELLTESLEIMESIGYNDRVTLLEPVKPTSYGVHKGYTLYTTENSIAVSFHRLSMKISGEQSQHKGVLEPAEKITVKSYSRGEKGSGITVANLSNDVTVEIKKDPTLTTGYWGCYNFRYGRLETRAASLKEAKEKLEASL